MALKIRVQKPMHVSAQGLSPLGDKKNLLSRGMRKTLIGHMGKPHEWQEM